MHCGDTRRPADIVRQRLGNLDADPAGWIEVAERVLKHDREAALPTQPTQRRAGHRGNIGAIEHHAAGQFGHCHIRQQLHHRAGQGAFTGAGLADDADAFPWRHRKVDAVHRAHHRAPDAQMHAHRFELQQRSRGHSGNPTSRCPARGFTTSFSPSASRFNPITAMQIATPGKTLIHHADCR